MSRRPVGPCATSTSRAVIFLRSRTSLLPRRFSLSTTVRRVPVATVVLPLPITTRLALRPGRLAVSVCLVAAADGFIALASRRAF